MSSDRSISEWLKDVKLGTEGDAQEQLVQRFLGRLTALASTRLRNLHAYEDEHDVALSALKTFFRRVSKGDFADATDRESLWSLLAAITIKKAASVQRRQLAEKRDVRRTQSLEALLREGPSEQFLDLMFVESNRLLDALEDDSQREVARLRMEGYSNREIAQRIDRSQTTVERKLRLVRQRLQRELEAGGE